MQAQNDNNLDEVRQQQNSAADLIRSKLNSIYNEEPDAKDEIAEVEELPQRTLSKHQRYMKELSESGRSLADIQTLWHEYYSSLPDNEKHEVWQEFYNEHERAKQHAREEKKQTEESKKQPKTTEPNERPAEMDFLKSHDSEAEQPAPIIPVSNNTATLRRKRNTAKKTTTARSVRKKVQAAVVPDTPAVRDIKQHLIKQVRQRSEVHKNPHVRALTFGLTMGFITVFVLLFGFFNERFITPFIRPNAHVSATPIIVDPQSNGPVGPEPKIIIPKINVEAPVVYDVPTIQEADVQKGLERGVVHYSTTPNPGEKGNAVIFGHSSSNILNKGKYKFAFLMLKSLDKDDTFIIQKDGKRYVYKVYNEFVTDPNDLSVLGPTDRPATVTLITCDPPGTSTHRLIIQAEQIFPDPNANAKSSVEQTAATPQPQQLPSNSESLWHRLFN